MTQIQTTRFGVVDVGEEHLISFRDGMIGFSALKRYALIESATMPLVIWLQSMDRPDIAFPLIEPYFFRRDYRPDLNEADKCSLGHCDGDQLRVFNVLTIPEKAESMTVNLKAPVIFNINRALAAQVILQEKSLEVRVPAHEAFSRALSQSYTTVAADENSVEATVVADVWNAVNVRSRPTQAEAGL